ncbi:MAG: hypothetical protein FWF09_08060 [Bacteroidales bacterium]|nr:hypothetical protein [Bacteroidales bacterium]
MEKRIKTIAKFVLLGLLFASLAGCTRDDDDDFTSTRDKYRGNWLCQDADGASYYATISSDPSNSARVVIQNYFDLKGTVTAYVTEGTITVDNQKMQGIPGTYWCEGNGSLTKKNGIYTIYWKLYAAGNDEIPSTYTKQ